MGFFSLPKPKMPAMQSAQMRYDWPDLYQTGSEKLVYNLEELRGAISEWGEEEKEFDIGIVDQIVLPVGETITIPEMRRQLKIRCFGKGRILVESGGDPVDTSVFTLNGEAASEDHITYQYSILTLENLMIGDRNDATTRPGILLNSKLGSSRVRLEGGIFLMDNDGYGVISDQAGGAGFTDSHFTNFELITGNVGDTDARDCIFSGITCGSAADLLLRTGASNNRVIGNKGMGTIKFYRTNFGGNIINSNTTGFLGATIDTADQTSGTEYSVIVGNNGFIINSAGGDTVGNNG